jgi:hypothetical protein
MKGAVYMRKFWWVCRTSYIARRFLLAERALRSVSFVCMCVIAQTRPSIQGNFLSSKKGIPPWATTLKMEIGYRLQNKLAKKWTLRS